ncbi:hypothetical protein J6590_000616 [Homalodisca vitripennis]|nr:hypothetical protein J6590_000616 [Homalodisca vitripennis]
MPCESRSRDHCLASTISWRSDELDTTMKLGKKRDIVGNPLTHSHKEETFIANTNVPLHSHENKIPKSSSIKNFSELSCSSSGEIRRQLAVRRCSCFDLGNKSIKSADRLTMPMPV